MTTLVFTGPESTGKTVLSNAIRDELVGFLPVILVPEIARAFYEQRIRDAGEPNYHIDDLLQIARAQREQERLVLNSEAELVLLDTDIVSTQVYAAHYYRTELPVSIQQELDALRAHSSSSEYILCGIDWPWSADPLRDRAFQRDELCRLFERELEGETIHRLTGTYTERLNVLRQIVGIY